MTVNKLLCLFHHSVIVGAVKRDRPLKMAVRTDDVMRYSGMLLLPLFRQECQALICRRAPARQRIDGYRAANLETFGERDRLNEQRHQAE